jgi:peptidoglycan/LPS O-acetylase OafA/YrhL
VGELSYPIYVVHILVKWVFLAAQGVERTGQAEVSGLGLLAGSVLVAAGIEKVVGFPLEKWRQRRARVL